MGKTLSRTKRLVPSTFVLTVTFVLILAGCATVPEATSPELLQTDIVSPVEAEPIPTENETETPDELADLYPLNPEAFDFAVLPEEDFPRGTWTVNQLIKKYGMPNNCKALLNRIFGIYEIVNVTLEFPYITIDFWMMEPYEFSFYKEDLEYGRYDLSESDKNIEQDIFSLIIEDPDLRLPYNIKILQSTKAQILDAYPENSGISISEEYNNDWISYRYAFLDMEGNVPEGVYGPGYLTYYFDEDEILKQVEIQWEDAEL